MSTERKTPDWAFGLSWEDRVRQPEFGELCGVHVQMNLCFLYGFSAAEGGRPTGAIDEIAAHIMAKELGCEPGDLY